LICENDKNDKTMNNVRPLANKVRMLKYIKTKVERCTPIQTTHIFQMYSFLCETRFFTSVKMWSFRF